MKIQALFALAVFILLTACQKEEPEPGPGELELAYAACCETEVLETSVGVGSIYVANIFTPNNDGINDIFFVQSDDAIAVLSTFRVEDKSGNVLHEQFEIPSDAVQYGWDGRVTSDSLLKGVFNYYLTAVDTNGVSKDFSGQACCFPCEDDPSLISNPQDCYFPIQHNGEGGLDPVLPNAESTCFE